MFCLVRAGPEGQQEEMKRRRRRRWGQSNGTTVSKVIQGSQNKLVLVSSLSAARMNHGEKNQFHLTFQLNRHSLHQAPGGVRRGPPIHRTNSEDWLSILLWIQWVKTKFSRDKIMVLSPDYLPWWWFEAVKLQLDVVPTSAWPRPAGILFCSRSSDRAVQLIGMEGEFKMFSKKRVCRHSGSPDCCTCIDLQ